MSTYNAVTWLLDRNVDEGRGGKTRLHRHRFRTDLWRTAEAELPRRQHAAPSRRPPRRARRHDHARHGGFSGRVSRRDPRRHRAGAAQHASDVGSIRLCAGGLPRAGAVHFRSAAAGGQGHASGGCPISTTSSSPARTRMATRNCPTNSPARAISFATVATHADEPAFWLYSSGSTGMPKGVRHLHANLAATADTYAKQVLGIREDDVGLSAAKLFFAYGLGNALTFPMSVGATTVLNSERPTPASMFALMNKYNPEHLLRRADAVLRDAERRGAEERARRLAPAHLHLRRRGAAGIGRQCLEGALRRRHSRRRRLDRAVAYLPVECARRHQIRHLGPPGAGLPGAAGQRSRRRGGRRRGRRNAGACAVGRRGLLEPAQQEPLDLRGLLDPHRRQIHSRRRRAATPSAAAATTCSRSPASGCRRSRSRAR